MDDELNELEAELKRLRPVGPSSELLRRIEAGLRPRRRLAPVVAWLGLPAAAGLAAMLVLSSRPAADLSSVQPLARAPAAAGAAPALKPVSADDLLVGSSDEGYVTLSDGTQARRTRRSYVDTVTWEDPSAHASLSWRIPRQQVSVQPVSFQ